MTTIDTNVSNYTLSELIAITGINNIDSEEIIEKTDKVFDLGYYRYGGGWSFGFRKKVIESF